MFVDQENPRYADVPVNAWPFFLGRGRNLRSTGYGLVSSVAGKLELD